MRIEIGRRSHFDDAERLGKKLAKDAALRQLLGASSDVATRLESVAARLQHLKARDDDARDLRTGKHFSRGTAWRFPSPARDLGEDFSALEITVTSTLTDHPAAQASVLKLLRQARKVAAAALVPPRARRADAQRNDYLIDVFLALRAEKLVGKGRARDDFNASDDDLAVVTLVADLTGLRPSGRAAWDVDGVRKALRRRRKRVEKEWARLRELHLA